MPLTPPVSENDHITGNTTASIELVEYGDFECPHCGRAYPLVKAALASLGGQVKFVFRNFPLSKIHPHAKGAAVAAEAAALQGRFWDMHAALFEHQRNLLPRAINEYAATLALDIDKFRDAINDETLQKKVDKQFMSGLRSGVDQTPGFFINGERYTGSWEGQDLQHHLTRLINVGSPD